MFLKRSSYIFAGLIFFVLLIGRFWSSQGMQWYSELNISPLTPPGWVFGVVWPVLYGLLIVYAIYIWNMVADSKLRNGLMALYGLNIFLNAFWTFLFFYQHNIAGALVDLIALWISTFVLILMTLKVSRFAAALLLPYVLWLSFALYLNYQVWILN